MGKPYPGWLSVLRWPLPCCAHHSPPSFQGVLGGGSLLPPSSTPAHSPTLRQSRRKLGESRGHSLLPRMTKGKCEEVLGGMGLFQKGVLNLRFDGKAPRDGHRWRSWGAHCCMLSEDMGKAMAEILSDLHGGLRLSLSNPLPFPFPFTVVTHTHTQINHLHS